MRIVRISGWPLATTDGGTGLADGVGGSWRVQAATVTQSRMSDQCGRARFMERVPLLRVSVDPAFKHSVSHRIWCRFRSQRSWRYGILATDHACLLRRRRREAGPAPDSALHIGWTKYARRSACSVMAMSCTPACALTVSLKHRLLSAVKSRISLWMATEARLERRGWLN